MRGKHAYSQKQDIVNQAWAWPANEERRVGCENKYFNGKFKANHLHLSLSSG